jgi:hypothetical protein
MKQQQQQQQQQQQTTALLCEYFWCNCLVNPWASSSVGCMYADSIPTNQTINYEMTTTTQHQLTVMMLFENTLCN